MNELSKKRLTERIADIEQTGTVKEMSDMFMDFIAEQDRVQEEMYSDFERRAKEYVYLIDDYRTAMGRFKRKYKRLQISYITLFLIFLFSALYYLLVEKYGLIDLNISALTDMFGT